MRTVRSEDPVVAVLVADIHLSLKCPSARLEEPCWFDAMRRAAKQLRKVAEEHDAPILCAGDVFDRWDSQPELINWALKYLPPMIAIPGNHDLPHHRPELMRRSAFWTLVAAGLIELADEGPRSKGCVDVCGRILNERVPPPEKMDRTRLKVLLTHEYIWLPGYGFEGAPREQRVRNVKEQYRGYDVVVVGDNHQPFSARVNEDKTLVWNCGGFMRRKTTDASFSPRLGLLRASGNIDEHLLDTEGDKLASVPVAEKAEAREREERTEAVADFVQGLASLEAEELSFRDAITQAMDARGISPEGRAALVAAMEDQT